MDKVKRLLENLKDVNADGRENIIRELGKIGDSRAVKPLVALLSDYNLGIRMATVEALGECGDTRAVKHLVRSVLEDESLSVRDKAVKVLSKMGNAVPLKPFIKALKEEKVIPWMNAAYCLGRLGRPEAVEPLIDIALDKKSYSREVAVMALSNIVKTMPLEPFIASLRDKESNTRKLIADVLTEIGWEASESDDHVIYLIAKQDWNKLIGLGLGKDVVQPLIKLLEDKDQAVVENAKMALRQIGDPGVLDLFITTFEKKRKGVPPEVLYLAITGQWDKLGDVDEDAVIPLINILTHKNAFIRRNAVQTLGKIGDVRAREALIDILKDWSVIVRNSAVEVLVKMADPNNPGPLLKLLKDSAAHARQAAAEVLNKTGWEPANFEESMLSLMSMGEWEKLPKKGEETIDVLIEALNVIDDDFRAKTVNSLSKIKEAVLTERLKEALKNGNRYVRWGAADVLRKTGWKPSNKKESALYLVAMEKWKKLSGLGKDAFAVLKDVLSFADAQAREIVVDTLGKIGDSRAIEPLIAAVDDPVRIIQEKAVAAFEKLRLRILMEDFDFVCENCLLRYRKHEATIKIFLKSSETVTYIACPGCRSDSHFYVGIKKIILMLDHNLNEPVVHDGDTLMVNWFKQSNSVDQGCQIDYDEIRIIDADNFEIEKLIIKLKNDMNNDRRERLPDVPIYLSSRLKLSQTQKNLLKDGFNTKMIKDD